jgi:hypothetical protein
VGDDAEARAGLFGKERFGFLAEEGGDVGEDVGGGLPDDDSGEGRGGEAHDNKCGC